MTVRIGLTGPIDPTAAAIVLGAMLREDPVDFAISDRVWSDLTHSATQAAGRHFAAAIDRRQRGDIAGARDLLQQAAIWREVALTAVDVSEGDIDLDTLRAVAETAAPVTVAMSYQGRRLVD